ncbi:monocarboxylate transporter 13-like isoform X2 [Corticium candelabrum]|uniref:monocarboxylate transporter 13-like isoform X2 n=1 Tax=Corticium candelabrum TaxID=121492 RepID=UPI002E264215|nr:monocarboxylate transporter 13-like isoform X2 [Corticium candelabrum]
MESRLNLFSPIDAVDRGWAWIVSGASFLLMFCVGGTVSSFAVVYIGFIEHYSTSSCSSFSNNNMTSSNLTLSACDGPRGLLAWVGSLSVFLMCAGGPVLTGLVDKVGPQRALLAGTMFLVSGLLLTSLTDTVWQLFLTYSVPIGVGSALVRTTSLSLLPYYFQTKLVVATSVAVTGRFVGVASLTPICRILMKSYGWRRMLQMSALVGIPMLACTALFRPSVSFRAAKANTMRHVVNCCKLQKNVRLMVYIWAAAVHVTAITIPATYIVEYAEQTLGVDENVSGLLLTAMALAAALSNILTVGGFSSLVFPFYHSYLHLVVYMIAQGVAFGYLSLVYVIPQTSRMVCVHDTKDVFALQSLTMAVGTLGTPVGGWMYDRMGSYTPGFLLSGIIAIVASITLFLDVYLQKESVKNNCSPVEKDPNSCMQADCVGGDHFPTVYYYETYV